MPNRLLDTDMTSYISYIFAGGIGMFVQDLLVKVFITTIALTFASRFVHRYKVWNEKNEDIKLSEFWRFLRFLKEGVKKNYKDKCED
tara:strand:+ start:47 stop:307 length:261 start_codon:yes stop_codon:yes gene_type:complete